MVRVPAIETQRVKKKKRYGLLPYYVTRFVKTNR